MADTVTPLVDPNYHLNVGNDLTLEEQNIGNLSFASKEQALSQRVNNLRYRLRGINSEEASVPFLQDVAGVRQDITQETIVTNAEVDLVLNVDNTVAQGQPAASSERLRENDLRVNTMPEAQREAERQVIFKLSPDFRRYLAKLPPTLRAAELQRLRSTQPENYEKLPPKVQTWIDSLPENQRADFLNLFGTNTPLPDVGSPMALPANQRAEILAVMMTLTPLEQAKLAALDPQLRIRELLRMRAYMVNDATALTDAQVNNAGATADNILASANPAEIMTARGLRFAEAASGQDHTEQELVTLLAAVNPALRDEYMTRVGRITDPAERGRWQAAVIELTPNALAAMTPAEREAAILQHMKLNPTERVAERAIQAELHPAVLRAAPFIPFGEGTATFIRSFDVAERRNLINWRNGLNLAQQRALNDLTPSEFARMQLLNQVQREAELTRLAGLAPAVRQNESVRNPAIRPAAGPDNSGLIDAEVQYLNEYRLTFGANAAEAERQRILAQGNSGERIQNQVNLINTLGNLNEFSYLSALPAAERAAYLNLAPAERTRIQGILGQLQFEEIRWIANFPPGPLREAEMARLIDPAFNAALPIGGRIANRADFQTFLRASTYEERLSLAQMNEADRTRSIDEISQLGMGLRQIEQRKLAVDSMDPNQRKLIDTKLEELYKYSTLTIDQQYALIHRAGAFEELRAALGPDFNPDTYLMYLADKNRSERSLERQSGNPNSRGSYGDANTASMTRLLAREVANGTITPEEYNVRIGEINLINRIINAPPEGQIEGFLSFLGVPPDEINNAMNQVDWFIDSVLPRISYLLMTGVLVIGGGMIGNAVGGPLWALIGMGLGGIGSGAYIVSSEQNVRKREAANEVVGLARAKSNLERRKMSDDINVTLGSVEMLARYLATPGNSIQTLKRTNPADYRTLVENKVIVNDMYAGSTILENLSKHAVTQGEALQGINKSTGKRVEQIRKKSSLVDILKSGLSYQTA